MPVSYRFAVESSPTQAGSLCSVAQFKNNSSDFHVFSTEHLENDIRTPVETGTGA